MSYSVSVLSTCNILPLNVSFRRLFFIFFSSPSSSIARNWIIAKLYAAAICVSINCLWVCLRIHFNVITFLSSFLSIDGIDLNQQAKGQNEWWKLAFLQTVILLASFRQCGLTAICDNFSVSAYCPHYLSFSLICSHTLNDASLATRVMVVVKKNETKK